jgi:hypothetical protein
MPQFGQDFEIFEGDTTPIEVTVRSSDGSLYPLFGIVLIWGFGRKGMDYPIVEKSSTILEEIKILNPLLGTAYIYLKEEDTRNILKNRDSLIFQHWMKIQTVDNVIETVMTGNMTLMRTVF